MFDPQREGLKLRRWRLNRVRLAHRRFGVDSGPRTPAVRPARSRFDHCHQAFGQPAYAHAGFNRRCDQRLPLAYRHAGFDRRDRSFGGAAGGGAGCCPSPYVLAACLLARLAEVARPEVSMGRPVAGWLQSTPLQLSADQRLRTGVSTNAFGALAGRAPIDGAAGFCGLLGGARASLRGSEGGSFGGSLAAIGEAGGFGASPRPPGRSSPVCFQRAGGSCVAARDGARARFPAPCRNRRP